MSHSRYHEKTVEALYLNPHAFEHERVHGLVIMHGVSGADELVHPSHILDNLSIMRGSRECREIALDSLMESHIIGCEICI